MAETTEIPPALERLEGEVLTALAEQGVRDGVEIRRRLHLRYAGTDTALPVAWDGNEAAARDAFEAAHLGEFGFTDPQAALIVEAVEVEGEAPEGDRIDGTSDLTEGAAEIEARVRFFSGGSWHEAAVVRRDALTPGRHVQGPGAGDRAEPDHRRRARLARRGQPA